MAIAKNDKSNHVVKVIEIRIITSPSMSAVESTSDLLVIKVVLFTSNKKVAIRVEGTWYFLLKILVLLNVECDVGCHKTNHLLHIKYVLFKSSPHHSSRSILSFMSVVCSHIYWRTYLILIIYHHYNRCILRLNL